MTSFFHILIKESFMQYAFLGGILACVACGIIGPFVVVRKISYIAGGVSHAVLAGLGAAYFFGANPIWGALVVAVIVALVIGVVGLKAKRYEEIIIGILWAMGMAIGVIFISKTPGYNADLMSYLFGNVLLISLHDIYLLSILNFLIIALVFLFYKRLVMITFDEEFAKVRGIRVNFYYLLLLCLVAFTVVSLVQVVGLILVLALLTIPAAIARSHVSSVAKMIPLAIIFGWFFVICGLSVSYRLDLPTGATIILFAVLCFVANGAFALLKAKV